MCWYCGSPINYPEPVGRSQVCPDCGKDLRSCANCRHFLPKERGCAEPQGENPAEKDRANFCDWFGLNPALRQSSGMPAGGENAKRAAESAKAAFNDLFK